MIFIVVFLICHCIIWIFIDIWYLGLLLLENMRNNFNLKLQTKASTLVSLKNRYGKIINIPELITIKKNFFEKKMHLFQLKK